MRSKNLRVFLFIFLIQFSFLKYAYPNYSIRCEGHSLLNGKSNNIFQTLDISYDDSRYINKYQIKYTTNGNLRKNIQYKNGIETHNFQNYTANYNWNNTLSSILDLKELLGKLIEEKKFITFKLNIIQDIRSGLLDIYQTIHMTSKKKLKDKVLLNFIPDNLNIQKTQGLPFTNIAYSTGPRYIQIKKQHGMASILRTNIQSAYFFNKVKCESVKNENSVKNLSNRNQSLKIISLRRVQRLGIIKIIFDLLVEAIRFNQNKFFWKDADKEINDKTFYKKLSKIIINSKLINDFLKEEIDEENIETRLFSLISKIYTRTPHPIFKKISKLEIESIIKELHSLLSTGLKTKSHKI